MNTTLEELGLGYISLCVIRMWCLHGHKRLLIRQVMLRYKSSGDWWGGKSNLLSGSSEQYIAEIIMYEIPQVSILYSLWATGD